MPEIQIPWCNILSLYSDIVTLDNAMGFIEMTTHFAVEPVGLPVVLYGLLFLLPLGPMAGLLSLPAAICLLRPSVRFVCLSVYLSVCLSVCTRPDLHHVVGLFILRDVQPFHQTFPCDNSRNLFEIFLKLGWNILWVSVSDKFDHGYRRSLDMLGCSTNVIKTTFWDRQTTFVNWCFNLLTYL